MIITLSEADAIDGYIELSDLIAIEQQIRQLTNNKFHHEHIRTRNISIFDNTIISSDELIGFSVDDTVEIIGTKYNDGLYVIEHVEDHIVYLKKFNGKTLINENCPDGELILVDYPLDIRLGVKEILEYKAKMKDKIGIKSERISRVQVTYNDTQSGESVEGVPSHLYGFLKKYRKLKW